jgi:hypothetical protein
MKVCDKKVSVWKLKYHGVYSNLMIVSYTGMKNVSVWSGQESVYYYTQNKRYSRYLLCGLIEQLCCTVVKNLIMVNCDNRNWINS